MSYGNNITEIFFKKGTNLITARNGQGKSALILEPLTFCVFGKPYRKIKIDELINDKNLNKLWTETIFIKGDDKYKIERGLKPAIFKLSKTHKSKEFTDKDELDLKSHKFLVQDEIDKIIGVDVSLWRQIISLSLLNNKPFLTLEAKDKRDLTESIFNIKIFGKMLKTLKKNHSVLASSVELKEKELELMKENLQGIFNQIKSLNKAMDDFEKEKVANIAEYDSKISVLQGELAEVESKILKMDPKKLASDVVDKKKLKTEISDLFGEWLELRTERDGILAQVRNPDAYPKLFDETIVEKIKSLDSERPKLNKELNALKDVCLVPKYLENNLADCVEFNREIIKLVTQLNNVQNDIERISVGQGQCEYCKQPISEDHKKEELEKFQKRESELISSIDSAKKKSKIAIENHISTVTKDNKSKTELINKRLDEIDEEIGTLKMAQSGKIISDLNYSLLSVEAKIEVAAKAKDRKEEELKALEESEKEIVSLKSEFEKLAIQRENIVSKLMDFQNASIKETNKKFSIDIKPIEDDCEIKKIRYKELSAKIKELKKQLSVGEVIKGILDEDGIKKYFFSRLIPKLNENINAFLDFFELPLNFKFDDTFEETIKELNRERSYFNFSGGERFRIDLSIVLSFMELNRMINSFNCNVLFFDELLDTGVDDEGMELVLEKIHELVEQNNNACYIISQRKLENSEFIDNIIKVSKVKGFSKIV